MNRRNLMKVSGLASAASLLSGCGTYTWNEKITVSVQTPDGDKSGSSVTKFSGSYGYSLGAGEGLSSRLQGEATVVDLGRGKYLFALMEKSGGSFAWGAFSDQLPQVGSEAQMAKLQSLVGEKAVLQPKFYPMLVTFGNLADPKSVKEVNASDLTATFGAGFALKSITLEITDEQVTEGVVFKLLPWAAKMNGSIGKDMNLPYGHLLNQINDGSFSSELRKP
jgi:hypothetical protein